MEKDGAFEIFLVAPPGLESALRAEAAARGFADARAVPGGVSFTGGWPEVWRANLEMRGASHVLARIAAFRVTHLAQLDKRARQVDWAAVLRPGVPVRVEAVCRKSRIYHSGAAAQRIETAIREELGAPVSPKAEVRVLVRIENDLATLSVDSSGTSLHRRGHKQEVNKAPMRETLAALFLRQCGFDGHEPVLDPMCGSGTFVIEAAEMALGLQAGRARGFAFEHLVSFDPARWQAMRAAPDKTVPEVRFFGSDRDAGAVRMSAGNAGRAGVGAVTAFVQTPIEKLEPPEGPPGLVIVNPPYGARIGERKALYPLYGALGQVLARKFSGWRVGLITSEDALARATGLPFKPPEGSVDNSGIRIKLWRTEILE